MKSYKEITYTFYDDEQMPEITVNFNTVTEEAEIEFSTFFSYKDLPRIARFISKTYREIERIKHGQKRSA